MFEPRSDPGEATAATVYERLPRDRWREIQKAEDAWWTVLFVDRIATPLAVLVTPWRVFTPKRITVSAHALAIVSLVLFSTGNLLAAAITFEVRFILDCVDGKLARARNTTSESGAFLDFAGDITLNSFLLGVAAAHEFDRGGLPLVAVWFLPSIYLLNWLGWHYASRRVAAGGAPMAAVVQAAVGGARQEWLRARRLRPLPRAVDFEHGAMFLAPVAAVALDQPWLFSLGLSIAGAYFSYQVIRVFSSEYRARALL